MNKYPAAGNISCSRGILSVAGNKFLSQKEGAEQKFLSQEEISFCRENIPVAREIFLLQEEEIIVSEREFSLDE